MKMWIYTFFKKLKEYLQISKNYDNNNQIQMQKYISTTRFNNETWNENQQYMKKIKEQKSNKKTVPECIYSLSHINQQACAESVFFVLEMNNDKNKIMGIGLVKNTPTMNEHKIYKKDEYNQYSYVGYYRIDRTEMNEREETIMKVFDFYCFTGSSHFKRLKGIKIFPQKIIDKCEPILDLLAFITNMFKTTRT